MFATNQTFDLAAEKPNRFKHCRRSSMQALQLPMSTSDSTTTQSSYGSVQSLEEEDSQGQDMMMTTQSIDTGIG